MNSALIIIDMQNDFMPGGSLAVPGGDEIIPLINVLQKSFGCVIATQDWHPFDHGSFASNHPDKKPFDVIELFGLQQRLWPDHCVQGSSGADFHADLNTDSIQAIFRKGMDPSVDSYSGFYDNGHRNQTGLMGYLRGLQISKLYFCGLAADYCVYFSIRDASQAGFECVLFADATRPISQQTFDNILLELPDKGINVMQGHDYS